MRKIIQTLFSLLLFLGLTFIVPDVMAQSQPNRVSDRSVQYTLNRIETQTDRFKRNMNRALDRSKYNNTDTEDNIFEYITQFENSTDKLKQKFEANESVNTDVTNVLNRAAFINSFMKNNRLASGAERDWRMVRSDLNVLARYYNVSYDWNAALAAGDQVYKKPYRVSDSTVKTLLSRIETRTDNFKRKLNTALDRSTLNNTDTEDMVFKYVTDFENSTDRLKRRFDANESVNADVENLLTRASSINSFMESNRLTRASERNWINLRVDLNTLASYYNLNYDWKKQPVDGRVMAYPVAGLQVSTLLARLESKTDTYKRLMNTALDRSVLNNTKSEDQIFAYITDFENATDSLKLRFDAKESTDKNALDVLNRASNIDTFMRDYRLLSSAEKQWRSIKSDLDMLSNYYSVSYNWERQYEPISEFDSMLTGTYRLNVAQSDPVGQVVKNAIQLYPKWNERRLEQRLTKRLSSPEFLAISKNSAKVEVASTNAPRVLFTSDGQSRTEITPNGKSVSITARTYYDGVSLSYVGDRVNDFYVNFQPFSGDRLRVVKRINVSNPDETITVASVYEKVDPTARWTIIVPSQTNASLNDPAPGNGFLIPNNTSIQAVMVSDISTKASQNGDRFKMKVTSPAAYKDAIIEGHVVAAKRSGLFSGRANVSLDFNTITLANGQTFRFAGLIEKVMLASGEKVEVNNEGQVRDNNQTSKTAKRAGIGAGLGAIVGAILSGRDGALIGAAVGAGAGAGTVVAQGRDDVELETGTTVEITATAPAGSDARTQR